MIKIKKYPLLNSKKFISGTKHDYIEKISDLYKTGAYYLRIENDQSRFDYYDTSVDPDEEIRDALTEEHRWLTNNNETVDFIIENIKDRKPKRILDFGCGPGWLLKKIKENFEVEAIGVENSSLANSHAQQIGVIHRDIVDVDGKFDLIIVNHVIEHLEDPVEVMKALLSILNKKGQIIIGTPNYDSAMAHLFRHRYRMLNEPTHISLFITDSLLRLLRDLGFEVEDVRFPFFKSPYFTELNIQRILDTELQSPPFFGNFILVRATKS